MDPITMMLLTFGGMELMKYLPMPDFLTPRKEKGELMLAKSQIDMQKKLMEAQKLMANKSGKRADEMMEKIFQTRQEDKGDVRQQRMFEMMMQSKTSRDAMMMSMLGSIMGQQNQSARSLPTTTPSLSSVVSLLR